VHYAGFRAWLGARLLGSRFATIRLRDDEIDPIAKRLGVDPDLLLEVRAQARVAMHEQGLSPPLSNRRKKIKDDSARLNEGQKRLYQYQMWMPPEIHEAWKAECERRGVYSPTMLRSLIHEYLLGAIEPQPQKYWVWQGQLLRAFRKKSFLDERAVIPHGAKRALNLRAARIGTQPTHLVRALIMETLAGGHAGIPLMQAGMMYDDETRYNTGS
jgi:hypothetical protein